MTQFLYLTGPEPDVASIWGARAVRIRPAHPAHGVEGQLPWSDLEDTWELRGDDGELVHDLCCDAQDMVILRGVRFRESLLGMLIARYLPLARRVTMCWPGDPVVVVTSMGEFLETIDRQFAESILINCRFLRA